MLIDVGRVSILLVDLWLDDSVQNIDICISIESCPFVKEVQWHLLGIAADYAQNNHAGRVIDPYDWRDL